MMQPSAKAYVDATPLGSMRIVTHNGLGELASALRPFVPALAEIGWADPVVVGRLAHGHGLDAEELARFTLPQLGARN